MKIKISSLILFLYALPCFSMEQYMDLGEAINHINKGLQYTEEKAGKAPEAGCRDCREVASEGDCFNPENIAEFSPRFRKAYQKETITQMIPLLKKAYKEYGIDPRLLFHRMIGESGGEPAIVNQNKNGVALEKRAYGIFQLLGPFYVPESPGKVANKRVILQEDLRKFERAKAIKAGVLDKLTANSNEIKSQRQLWQLEYYVDYYLRGASSLAQYSACKTSPKKVGLKWEQLSNFQKEVYLGWGQDPCAKSNIDKENAILSGEHAAGSYDTNIIKSLLGMEDTRFKSQALALCKDW